LGLGATSIREALTSWSGNGFVTLVANRGIFVTQLSLEDTQQIYRVAMELEDLVVERSRSISSLARGVMEESLELFWKQQKRFLHEREEKKSV
jgi:DNA-binding GntR family transcriptional regulator